MGSIQVYLKREGIGWSIYTKDGHRITGPRTCKHEFDAMEWARIFVSGWYNWTVTLDNGDQKDEKKD